MGDKNYQSSSKEEDLAWEIWICINRYYSTIKGYTTLKFPKTILEKIHFEILNKETIIGKNVLFSYILKPETNIKNIEIHLMTIGINRAFIDKSNSDKKRYLSVWKKK